MIYILKRIGFFALLITVAVSLALMPACSKKEDKKEAAVKAKSEANKKTDGEAPAVEVVGGAGAPVAPVTAPEEVEEEVYSYNVIRSDGQPKRDPFTPIKIIDVSPIMQYDISQLQVNGVIIHGIRTANIITPDGASTKVRVGDPIGIHDGFVVDITLDGIKIRETYYDVRGRIQEYERIISNRR